MNEETKTKLVGLQTIITFLTPVLNLINTGITLWEVDIKPAYCPLFTPFGWICLGMLVLSVFLLFVLHIMNVQRRIFIRIIVSLSVLIFLGNLFAVFIYPNLQQRSMQKQYSLYIQVAQFRELGVNAQLSNKIIYMLDQELHQHDLSPFTAGVGRCCKDFGPDEHEKAELYRDKTNSAMLFYGWLDDEGGECYITVDRARLPSLPVNIGGLFEKIGEKLGMKPSERVDPALAFIIFYRDITQNGNVNKIQSKVIGDIKECCVLFGAGLAYHMDQDSWSRSSFPGWPFLYRDLQLRAIELFQKALDRDCPSTQQISLFKGNAYAVLEKYYEAEEAWKEAVNGDDPNSVQARINLAALAIARGDSTSAMVWLMPVVDQLTADNIPARYLLASTYAMNGQYKESMNVWQSVLSLEPDDHIAIHNANLMQDMVDLSRTQSSDWIEENILKPLAYRNLGIGLISIDRHEQAELVLKRALGLNYIDLESYPSWELKQDLHLWLGIAYGKQGRFDEWEEQWSQMGLSRADILRLPVQHQDYWRDLLGPEVYKDLEYKFGPQVEMFPVIPEPKIEQFRKYEYQIPVMP